MYEHVYIVHVYIMYICMCVHNVYVLYTVCTVHCMYMYIMKTPYTLVTYPNRTQKKVPISQKRNKNIG
jgi:hypothetical protein